MELFRSYIDQYAEELDTICEMVRWRKGANKKYAIPYDENDAIAIKAVLKALKAELAEYNYKPNDFDKIDAIRQLLQYRYSDKVLSPQGLAGRDPREITFKVRGSALKELKSERPKLPKNVPNLVYTAKVPINARELFDKLSAVMDIEAYISPDKFWQGMPQGTAISQAFQALQWLKGKQAAPNFNVDNRYKKKKTKKDNEIIAAANTRRFGGAEDLGTKNLEDIPLDDQDMEFMKSFKRKLSNALRDKSFTPERQEQIKTQGVAQALGQRYSDKFIKRTPKGNYVARSKSGLVTVKMPYGHHISIVMPIDDHIVEKFKDIATRWAMDFAGAQRLWDRKRDTWQTDASLQTVQRVIAAGAFKKPGSGTSGHEFVKDDAFRQRVERQQERYIAGQTKSPNNPISGHTPEIPWEDLVRNDVKTGVQRAIRDASTYKSGDYSELIGNEKDVMTQQAFQQVYMGMSGMKDRYLSQAERIKKARTVAYQFITRAIDQMMKQRPTLDAPVGGEEGRATSIGGQIAAAGPHGADAAFQGNIQDIGKLSAMGTPEDVQAIINWLYNNEGIERYGDKLKVGFDTKLYDKEELVAMIQKNYKAVRAYVQSEMGAHA